MAFFNKSPNQTLIASYDQLYARVFRFVRWRTTSDEDAKDLVSIVFLKAVEHIEQLDEKKGTLEQWLLGIAKRALIDHWRSRKITLPLDEIAEPVDPNDVVETIVNVDASERVLACLGETERALLVMRFVDGWSHVEIAEATNRTPDAVRQQFARLIRRLRAQFNPKL